MRQLIFVLITGVCGFAQGVSSSYPYLLRLENDNSPDRVCVLLQKSGSFHLEMAQGDATRIFEGKVGTSELADIERNLDTLTLAAVSQGQIEEPLMRSHDMLQTNVVLADHWQNVLFERREGQEPVQKWLHPLLRLLGP